MAYRPAAEVLIGCVRLPRFAVQVERWRFPELAAIFVKMDFSAFDGVLLGHQPRLAA